MHTLIPVVILALSAAAFTARAEVIQIPVGQQSPELQGMEVPKRSMTAAEVEAQFGAPQSKSGPVGNPPISSWEYDKYVVYFEGDRVLHSVLKH